ncbi:MAG TPA: FtsX-like permease family protein [Pseudomonadales bacterium]
MSEVAPGRLPAAGTGRGLLTVRIGWRNLWRNRRRTWLTTAGIAFAVWLVVSFMALQVGQYDTMEENATALMAGHVQVQNALYLEDNRFEETISQASAVVDAVRATAGVAAVAPRVEVFALASVDERSFGAQLLGIDIAAEQETVRFVRMLASGRSLEGPEDAVLGTVLARNLGADVGDEVVVLGTGKEGGVAALVFNVVGLLETGMADLDRVLMLAPLAEVQAAFGLEDEVHTLVIRVEQLDASAEVVSRLQQTLPGELAVRNWDRVLPELKQGIEVDRIGGRIMYGIIMALVVFSVVNSFIMTVFERTREFGMLLAIGMRPTRIILMLQWEALFVCLLGIGIGLLLALGLTLWLMEVGIYLGEAMEEYAQQFYMPDRMYPALSWEAFTISPLVMLVGTQLAALLPSLRIRRLKAVEALRSE